MEKASLFFLLMLLACTTTVVHCTNKSIFILAGQSNMVGEGGVNKINTTTLAWDGVIPPDCQSNPQILRLNNDSLWEVAEEPLHKGIGPAQTCGIGPGIPFAKSTLKPGETIGLVPCAVAGTPLRAWVRGTDNYNRMVNRAQAALANGGGTIRALLWFQGEADTYNINSANAYKANLVRMFNDLRNDLCSPSLPIIQVALVSGGDLKNVVREAQLNLGLINVYCVDGLKLKNMRLMWDNLHLTAQSQVELGKEMASVFRNISGCRIY